MTPHRVADLIAVPIAAELGAEVAVTVTVRDEAGRTVVSADGRSVVREVPGVPEECPSCKMLSVDVRDGEVVGRPPDS